MILDPCMDFLSLHVNNYKIFNWLKKNIFLCCNNNSNITEVSLEEKRILKNKIERNGSQISSITIEVPNDSVEGPDSNELTNNTEIADNDVEVIDNKEVTNNIEITDNVVVANDFKVPENVEVPEDIHSDEDTILNK